ncbi:MAG: cell division protein FtsA [Alphaproteobacteria bacterium]|nr:MAG: cell division protein FtsA [Alphaproteobacteria bacterium]
MSAASFSPLVRPRAQALLRRDQPIAALDVGTSKIACLIGVLDENDGLKVIGIGHQAATGMRQGMVVDVEAAHQSITQAMDSAEQMAGTTAEHVLVTLGGAPIRSREMRVEMEIGGREVTAQDVNRAFLQATNQEPEEPSFSGGAQLETVHLLPSGFLLDGHEGIHDPRGLVGHQLVARVVRVEASYTALHTLLNTLTRCGVERVQGLSLGVYASGFACLTEDEMQLGATIVDMGAGTTSFALFSEGEAVHMNALPIGGAHVTADIAHGLTTSLPQAERLKILHGNALPSPSDDRAAIDVLPMGESVARQRPRSELTRIIRPRVEEIFEMLRESMDEAALRSSARRVVLTGGASQMPGMVELAERKLERPVRLGQPFGINGLDLLSADSPAFSSAVGLLLQARRPGLSAAVAQSLAPSSWLGKAWSWVRQNI